MEPAKQKILPWPDRFLLLLGARELEAAQSGLRRPVAWFGPSEGRVQLR